MHVAVLTGGLVGLWQVAVVWGIAISLAIYATSAVSGAHINPAITLAFASFRGFPSHKVAPYVLAQLLGAIAAAGTLYALFGSLVEQFEAAKGLVRGQPGSQLSAMWFGEYFPNPAVFGTDEEAFRAVSVGNAFAAEVVGTAFLLFFVLALTDRRNPNAPAGRSNLYAFFIGFTVAILISVIAPLTQGAFNPARDFSPRLFAALAGWGRIALPGPRWGFWIYIVAPMLGAVAGAAVYTLCLNRQYRKLGEPATVEAD